VLTTDPRPLTPAPQLKVTKQVLSTCCAKIKNQVLSKVGTCDLSNITVQISRLDGQWDQLRAEDALHKCVSESVISSADATEDQHLSAAQSSSGSQRDFNSALHVILHKQRTFHLRFELEFDLIPQVVV
jgi:hypothetical protein